MGEIKSEDNFGLNMDRVRKVIGDALFETPKGKELKSSLEDSNNGIITIKHRSKVTAKKDDKDI